MSKFAESYKTFTSPVCNQCAHHIKGSRCKAFERIPDVIFTGENDHSKPLPNQGNTYVFKAKKLG